MINNINKNSISNSNKILISFNMYFYFKDAFNISYELYYNNYKTTFISI